MFKFDLGARVSDVITGFKGVVTARTEWLNGCKRYVVQSEKLDKDNKPVDLALDEEQMKVVGKPVVTVISRPGGGPRPAPQQRADPSR